MGEDMKTKQLQDFIRSNGYACPGGYQCALLMADGYIIDARAARENYKLIRRAANKDWEPVEVFIHWEGPSIWCDVSGREIPSAYGDPDQE